MANLSLIISSEFFAIKDNLLFLKITSFGTIADLTLAHKKLQAPAWHPIKKTKKYNGLSEFLNAAIKLKSLKALLDALIRRRSWHSLLVLQEAEIVLEKPKTANPFF